MGEVIYLCYLFYVTCQLVKVRWLMVQVRSPVSSVLHGIGGYGDERQLTGVGTVVILTALDGLDPLTLELMAVALPLNYTWCQIISEVIVFLYFKIYTTNSFDFFNI